MRTDEWTAAQSTFSLLAQEAQVAAIAGEACDA